MALLLTPVDASEDVSIILFKCFFFLLWVWQGVSGVNPTPSITVTFLISFKFLFHSSSFHCLPPRRSYFIAAAPILLPVPYVLFMTIFFLSSTKNTSRCGLEWWECSIWTLLFAARLAWDAMSLLQGSVCVITTDPKAVYSLQCPLLCCSTLLIQS